MGCHNGTPHVDKDEMIRKWMCEVEAENKRIEKLIQELNRNNRFFRNLERIIIIIVSSIIGFLAGMWMWVC